MAVRSQKKQSRKPPRRSRSHLVQWGRSLRERGANLLVVGLAQFVAYIGEDLASIQNALGDGTFQQLGRLQSPEVWESFYLRPHKFIQFLGNQTASGSEVEAAGIPLGDLTRGLVISGRVCERMPKSELLADINELLNDCEFQLKMMELRGAIAHKLEAFEKLLETRTLETVAVCSDELAFSQQAQFLMRVFWPCICEFGQTPFILYRLAREGNVSAIEKLVRIDARVLRIPRIADILEDWRAKGDVPKCEIVAKAQEAPRRKRASPRAEKIRGIALIWQAGRLMDRFCGQSLTIEDMRDAFDAAAKDRGLTADPHLPAGEEALRKGVSRMSKKLPADLWDMFGRKAVP